MPSRIPLIDGDIFVYKAITGVKGDFVQMVEMFDGFVDSIQDMFGNKPLIFLSGPNNFRYQVATIKPYKGNRPKEKPRYFKAMREYMIDFHGALVSEGVEADDVIASRSNEETVIVSTDKDFKTVPNTWIYNPTKNTLDQTNEYSAKYNLFYQMLVGDAADAIPGIDGIGDKKASKMLADKTEEEMEETVKEMYRKQYKNEWPSAYTEILTLLSLRRDCANSVKQTL